MDKKRLAHRWSSALRIVAALMIVFSSQIPLFAGVAWYSYGGDYTGPVGRVLEWRYVYIPLYGYSGYSSVSYSTDPYRTMSPVWVPIASYTNPGGLSGGALLMYKRHEHNFTPSPLPEVVMYTGQTSSTILIGTMWWGASTLEY